MDDIEVRELQATEFDAAIRLNEVVFHTSAVAGDERANEHRALERMDRIGAFAGGSELVGFVAARDLSLTAPGGEVRCAGVTWVGVLPTHRRRGVLRRLMGELLDRAAADGRPVAALWAAEGGIYGRYGFGVATRNVSLAVDGRRPLATRVAPSEAPLRLLDGVAALPAIRALHDELRPLRGGRPARADHWWEERTLHRESDDPNGTLRTVVLGAPGAEEGYATYQAGRAPYPSARIRLVLRELEARTPAAEAALWRYLTSIDLSDGVDAELRPEDDRLLTLADDPDAVVATGPASALWVRVLDVPALLSARAWATAVDCVLEVADADRPANAGRWRVRPGSCVRTDDPADLALDVRELASIWLGAPGALRRLHDAGLVEERTPGAVAALQAALDVPRAPFAPEHW